MEDDLEVFCDDPWEKLNTVLMWLKNSPQIGGSRILKWEMDNTERYNKHAMDMSKVDKANMQTHRNIITGQSLNMHAVDVISDDRKLCRLVQTNWHWYNFPVICKTEVYDSIIPREDIEPLQAQEGLMMKLYADTGLNMGAVDEGIVTHLAPPTPTSGTSVRYHMKNKFANSELKPENMGKEMPIISMEEAVLEAEVALEELRKHVNT